MESAAAIIHHGSMDDVLSGLSWDMTPADGGERWGARLEIYLTDPEQEPDMSKWHTQLAFLLAD